MTKLVAEHGLEKPQGKRRLNEAGKHAVDAAAEEISALVDELIQKRWNRTTGAEEKLIQLDVPQSVQATCSCGSGIPVQDISVGGQTVTLIALPLIFQQLLDAGKPASPQTTKELLETVKIYNPIPAGEDEIYAAALAQEYALFCEQRGAAK